MKNTHMREILGMVSISALLTPGAFAAEFLANTTGDWDEVKVG